MNSNELRKKFLDFFAEKGHVVVPSSSLIPADSSVLFTSAGMQQFIPYLTGEKNVLSAFNNRHLSSVQKCFRANDIDEVGDDTHHTFFEMLGNWSIGQDSQKGYFKEGAIGYALEFFTEIIGLDKNKFWITVFSGNQEISQDKESIEIWKKKGISENRIVKFGMEDNFWGPVSDVGPCGPCSEIHYDRGKKYGCGEKDCGPNCKKCNRFVELWNLVFMEYNKNKEGSYTKLPQQNVDTGIGFERLAFVLSDKDSAYETDLFLDIIHDLEEISGKKYEENKRYFRIITDHLRGSVFLISAGIVSSNVERGYVLRRILRRAIRYGKLLNLKKNFLLPLARKVISIYGNVYPELNSEEERILSLIQKEEEKFEKTLEAGLKEFDKNISVIVGWEKDSKNLLKKIKKTLPEIPGPVVFKLVTTYGFPIELIKEIAKEKKLCVDEDGFNREMEKHQEISRMGAKKKFGGGGEFSPKLHTATHLLHAALRDILGEHVKQMGSDITDQRLRFDFSHSQKMTEEEIKKVEDLVNRKIKENLKIEKEEMNFEQALSSGALAFFKEKYPDKVTVYRVGDFSKEICAGPHAEKTSDLGIFKIVKEESSGAGVRRIRAILISESS